MTMQCRAEKSRRKVAAGPLSVSMASAIRGSQATPVVEEFRECDPLGAFLNSLPCKPRAAKDIRCWVGYLRGKLNRRGPHWFVHSSIVHGDL